MSRATNRLSTGPAADILAAHRRRLISRRRFLVQAAGGSVALLFGVPAVNASSPSDSVLRTLDTAQRHLLPSEADAPGAAEIDAIGYLQFVLADPRVDPEERELILTGASWLEERSRALEPSAFTGLDQAARERVLVSLSADRRGELWISTLLVYTLEALVSAPSYGGNPGGIGWKWLEHTAGFPLPPPEKTYPRLDL